MKNILVTGGAGFIGAHFIPYFLDQHLDYHVVNLDKLTYAGNLDHLKEINTHPRYTFVAGDVTDQALVNSLFKRFHLEGIIHFAAETHVDRSIQDATNFIKTNVEGTFVVLEAARKSWLSTPGILYPQHQDSKFLQISTDEVYGSLGLTGYFTEESCYAPNNPYSATKAAGDFLVRSYHHTYGLQVITTHGSNTYGPKQYPEKLIPRIIHHALSHQPIPIHGYGTAIRDWLYVLDHCKGIDAAFHFGKAGQHYNIGGQDEMTNLEVANRVCAALDRHIPLSNEKSYASLLTFVEERPGNDQRYALAIDKAKNYLNWQPQINFNMGIQETVSWYIRQYTQGE